MGHLLAQLDHLIRRFHRVVDYLTGLLCQERAALQKAFNLVVALRAVENAVSCLGSLSIVARIASIKLYLYSFSIHSAFNWCLEDVHV